MKNVASRKNLCDSQVSENFDTSSDYREPDIPFQVIWVLPTFFLLLQKKPI